MQPPQYPDPSMQPPPYPDPSMQPPQYPDPSMHPTGLAPLGQGYPPAGPPPGYGPMPGYPPGYGPMPQRRTIDLGRIGAAVTALCGLVVLFASLMSLYSVEVTPSNAPDAHDIDSGTVEVGVGFFSVVPFTVPIVALAIPVLMLVAALTGLPTLLGRAGQGALVSAVSACTSVLLAFVLMLSNPLPSVHLNGTLAKDFAEQNGVSVDKYVDAIVSIGPGAGLIVSFIFGLIGAVGAVLTYLSAGKPR